MSRSTLRFTIVAFLSLVASLTAAHAGLFRTYVSSTGADGNPCTLPQPCRLLPAALAAVNDGGEIWMLDSANFNTGTVTINKSVAILAVPGAIGSVVASGGDAILISGNVTSRVILRNIIIVNLGGGTNGVNFVQGSSLSMQDCSVTGVIIGVNLNTVSGRVRIVNSFFRQNTTGVQDSAGLMDVIDSTFEANATAIGASGNGGANNNPPNGPTRVRVSGGNILDNTVAYSMTDPGLHDPVQGTCNGINIWLRSSGSPSPGYPNAVGNGSYISMAGSFDGQCNGPPPIYQLGQYIVSTQNTQTVP